MMHFNDHDPGDETPNANELPPDDRKHIQQMIREGLSTTLADRYSEEVLHRALGRLKEPEDADPGDEHQPPPWRIISVKREGDTISITGVVTLQPFIILDFVVDRAHLGPTATTDAALEARKQ
jgi:hypothetical protein